MFVGITAIVQPRLGAKPFAYAKKEGNAFLFYLSVLVCFGHAVLAH